jgi:hypothetical protein
MANPKSRREVSGRLAFHRHGFDDFTLVQLRTPENDFELELTINRAARNLTISTAATATSR